MPGLPDLRVPTPKGWSGVSAAGRLASSALRCERRKPYEGPRFSRRGTVPTTSRPMNDRAGPPVPALDEVVLTRRISWTNRSGHLVGLARTHNCPDRPRQKMARRRSVAGRDGGSPTPLGGTPTDSATRRAGPRRIALRWPPQERPSGLAREHCSVTHTEDN